MTDGLIPKRYRNATLADWPEDKDPRTTVDPFYAKMVKNIRSVGGIIVQGANGVGKTRLVSAIANDLYGAGVVTRRPVYVMACDVPDLYSALDDFREQPWRVTMHTASLLIIDDLGKEDRAVTSNSTWKREVATQKIGAVLRARVQAQRPTFLTTNLTDDRLAEEYGPSIHSLLHEVGDLWTTMTGKDRRKE